MPPPREHVPRPGLDPQPRPLSTTLSFAKDWRQGRTGDPQAPGPCCVPDSASCVQISNNIIRSASLAPSALFFKAEKKHREVETLASGHTARRKESRIRT